VDDDKIYLDGYEVKAGSRLWSIEFGWGTNDMTPIVNEQYPIFLEFDRGGVASYTPMGKRFTKQGRTLYWDEVDITPPPPPKQKVKKWQWLYKWEGQYDTTRFFRTSTEAERSIGDAELGPRIEESMIEVEE